MADRSARLWLYTALAPLCSLLALLAGLLPALLSLLPIFIVVELLYWLLNRHLGVNV